MQNNLTRRSSNLLNIITCAERHDNGLGRRKRHLNKSEFEWFRSSSLRNDPDPEMIPRGTQRGYSAKPLKHSIVNRILVFKR